jgi:membrane protein DedA with SNARE-associated domain
MLFVISPLSIVLLGMIVYFALSRQSSRALRLTAMAALGFIILAVLICVIIIFANMGFTSREPVIPDFLAAEPPPPPKENFLALFLLAFFLIAFLGVVIILSLRERKRQQNHSS